MKLYDHQRHGMEALTAHQRYGLWWDCGTGKTATVLSAVKQLQPCRALVVCPLSIIKSAWMSDAATWASDLTIASWHDKGTKFWHADIAVINYESLRANKDAILRHQNDRECGWDMLVLDESSKIKNPTSKISKFVREFAHTFRRVVLLSGTPAPNDPLEYWSQLYCIDPQVLGKSFYKYRHWYGSAREIYAAGGRKVQTYAADPKKMPDMYARIATVSHRLKKEDCLDLPDQVDEVIEVGLGREERKAYETMKKDLILRFEDTEAVGENALAEVMKLRQICNGWVFDNERTARQLGNSKFLALKDVLDSIGNEQAIIWCEYRHDVDAIATTLDAVKLYGGLSDADREQAIGEFKSKNTRYLVAHPASAGHGLTFTNATYAIYFGLGYSYELHEQSRDRIHRIGQERKCTYIYLLAAETIEQHILKVVQGKAAAIDVANEYLGKGAAVVA